MGKYHEEKIEIMRKYLEKIASGFSCYIDRFPRRRLEKLLGTLIPVKSGRRADFLFTIVPTGTVPEDTMDWRVITWKR